MSIVTDGAGRRGQYLRYDKKYWEYISTVMRDEMVNLKAGSTHGKLLVHHCDARHVRQNGSINDSAAASCMSFKGIGSQIRKTSQFSI